jgi:hypothetical protein
MPNLEDLLNIEALVEGLLVQNAAIFSSSCRRV